MKLKANYLFLIFFVITGVTFSTYLYFNQINVEKERAEKTFYINAQRKYSKVKNHFSKYYYHLENLCSFYSASSFVDALEFDRFTKNLFTSEKISGVCWTSNIKKDEKYYIYADELTKKAKICEKASILDPLQTITVENNVYIMISKGAKSLKSQTGLLSVLVNTNVLTMHKEDELDQEYLILNDTNYKKIQTFNLINGRQENQTSYAVGKNQVHRLFEIVEANGVYVSYLIKKTIQQVHSQSLSVYLAVSILGVFLTLTLGYIILRWIQEEDFIKEKVKAQTELIEKSHKEIEKQKSIAFHKSKLASLGEMAAGVAHEINNPLAIILGSIAMIERNYEKKPKVISSLDNIEKSVERISKIVKGLKKFSRSSNQPVLIEKSLINLVNECIEISEIKSKRSLVAVSSKIEQNIVLKIDEIQIEQILINLISNAIDSIDQNEEKWVEISYGNNEDKHEIIVKDSGTGIDQKLIDKLFDPFFTTKEVGKGTGLGLSISKGIAQDHGGDLEYRLIDGHTAFILTLPKTTVSANET